MTAANLVAALGSYGGVFAVGALARMLPLLSIDVFLVALALATRATPATAIAVLATGGQLVGKLRVQRRVLDFMRPR